jgi:hypothetical protein
VYDRLSLLGAICWRVFIMRVLLTGHLGYIGTVLTPMLLKAGHPVVGLDSDIFERCTYSAGGKICRLQTIRKDVRDIGPDDVAGFDAILHLAALSNDPLGDLQPDVTEANQPPCERADRRACQERRGSAFRDRVVVQQLRSGR